MRNIACGFVVLFAAAVTASGARADIINGGFENGTYLDAGGFAVPNGWVASNWDTVGSTGLTFRNIIFPYTVERLTFKGTGSDTVSIFAVSNATFWFVDDVSIPGVTAVPAPISGAGLPGLLPARAGLLALARRRRRRQVALINPSSFW
jgi:hypothetical protein